MNKYKYTKIDLEDNPTSFSEISQNDIVMLNGNNIMTSIAEADEYVGLNPIPSFDLAKGISSAASADIKHIKDNYFKLSGDNIISGNNVFYEKQSINDISANRAKINTAQLDNATVNDLSVNRLCANVGISANDIYSYGCLSALNSKLTKSSISSAEISYIEVSALSVKSKLCTDFNSILDVGIEGEPVSLHTQLSAISGDIEQIHGDIKSNSGRILSIENTIDAAQCQYQFDDSNGVSIITSISQLSGKITANAKKLTSADVDKLDNYVEDYANSISTAISSTVSSNYLLKSGGKITGSLVISNDITIGSKLADVKIGDTNLCSLVSCEIQTSSDNTYRNLSGALKDNFDFKYDTSTNMISATVAGKTIAFSANKFTERGMLQNVHVELNSELGPILWLIFDTSSGIENLSIELNGMMPLYEGNNGIAIALDSTGKYNIVADSTICRRSDISSINLDNSLNADGYILTSLAQTSGKISYSATKLLSSHILGLTQYVEKTIEDSERDLRDFTSTLSGDSGVLSSLSSAATQKINQISGAIKLLSVDNPGFYDENGKIKTLTALSEVDGKINIETATLNYADVNGLSEALDGKLDKSGGSIDGSLSVAKTFLVNGGTSNTTGPNGGVAIGRNSVLNNEESFVWSGAQDESTQYADHGQHTFNINPENGISGFYIGEKSLDEILETTLMKEISWLDLKNMRDEGKLTPGQQYRIIDYVATTNKDHNSKSANHPFDIVVVADDEKTLNENARAIMHEQIKSFNEQDWFMPNDYVLFYNDRIYKCINNHKGWWNWNNFVEETPYFYECNLNAWKIQYCLDNDVDRFAWAIDDGRVDAVTGTFGKGVIYHMIDEFNNDLPYDFKGLIFTIDSQDYYTFTNNTAGVNKDASLIKNNAVYNNYIECSIDVNTQQQYLNPNLFINSAFNNKFGPGCLNNKFEPYCSFNKFESGCSFNKFGLSCSNNEFGSYCLSNEFGSYCSNNRFGLSCSSNEFISCCQYNEFGPYCWGNKFDLSCQYNKFGSYCLSNEFKSKCMNIEFGSQCMWNIFETDCWMNTFGSGCSHNHFGLGCQWNEFGPYCWMNTFGSDCQRNEFGPYCESNRFGEGCWSNKFGPQCQNTEFGSDCESNIFESQCLNSKFGSRCSHNEFGPACEYNTFKSDCMGNKFGSSCNDNEFESSCSGNEFGSNCYENIFGSNCSFNRFGPDCFRNNFNEYIRNIVFKCNNYNIVINKSYVQNITIDSSCSYITFNIQSTTSSTQFYQNVEIKCGIKGSADNTVEIIADASQVNQPYLTTYKPANSYEISI